MAAKATIDTTSIPGLIAVMRDSNVLFVCNAFSIIALTPGYDDPVGAVQISFDGWTKTVPVPIEEMTRALKAGRAASEKRYINQQAKASIASHAKAQSPS